MSKVMHQMSATAERAGVARGEALRDPVSDETQGTTHDTEELIDKQDVVSAEIAARLLVQDFPDHAAAVLLLQEVLALNGVKA